MATLFDTQESKLVEYALIERKMWAYQEGKVNLIDMLSWSFGPYALRVLHSPDMRVRTKELNTKNFLAHMVERISEQEEFVGAGIQLFGTRTGAPRDVKDATGTVKLESSYQKTRAFNALFEKSGNVDSDGALWRNAWRIAYAKATRYLTDADAKEVAKERGVSPAILAHAIKNWQTESPKMLNASYQNKQAKKAPTTPAVAPVAENGKVAA